MAVTSDPFGEALLPYLCCVAFWGGNAPVFCPPQGFPGNYQEKWPYTSQIEMPAYFQKYFLLSTFRKNELRPLEID